MSLFLQQMKRLLLLFLLITVSASASNGDIYMITSGRADMLSYAPLEVIRAHSSALKGAINTTENTFAFAVDSKTFEGFNSDLQREHFNDNYMESARYPRSTFAGKIIEKIDFTTDGIHDIRAKGKLVVHGVEQERIIRVRLEIRKGRLLVHSKFSVLLKDHAMVIPKIVYQKIAEEIEIEIQAELTRK
jgi:hypothetical protein